MNPKTFPCCRISNIGNINDFNRYIRPPNLYAYLQKTVHTGVPCRISLCPLSHRLKELFWLLNLKLNGGVVLPTFCLPYVVHVSKYTTPWELQPKEWLIWKDCFSTLPINIHPVSTNLQTLYLAFPQQNLPLGPSSIGCIFALTKISFKFLDLLKLNLGATGKSFLSAGTNSTKVCNSKRIPCTAWSARWKSKIKTNLSDLSKFLFSIPLSKTSWSRQFT